MSVSSGSTVMTKLENFIYIYVNKSEQYFADI